MSRIRLNFKLFGQTYFRVLTAITAAISLVLLFIDKENLGIKSPGCGCIWVAGVLLVPAIVALIWIMIYRSVKVKEESPVIKIQYGDLWKEAFPKKTKGKRIVVINVNTTFDVIVDEDISKIQKPLVSPTTMHGQLIKRLKEKGIGPEKLLEAIKENLEINKIEPVRTISREVKPRGETECYEKGTVAVYEYENTIFYLLAFSEFNEDNKAQNSKEEMVKTVTKLVDFYDAHGQGYEMFVPLMGTGMSRTGISAQDSLKILSSVFDIHSDRLRGDVTIVVYEKDRDKIALAI